MQWLKRIYLFLVYLFLYIPIIIIIVFSFNSAQRSLLWHGFSLHWYQVLLHNAALGVATLHSLILGILSASLATFIGMVAAVTLFRYDFFAKKLLNVAIFALIVLPDLVLGVALLTLFSVAHFPVGFFSLLIAHITFCIPFTTITISARLQSLDKNIIEASQDLGASEGQMYRRILVPMLLPSILASWLLSFTLSLDDVIVSYFVSGPSFQILPLKIFSMVKIGISPEINALCTFIVLLTFILVICSQILQRKK